MQNGRAMRIASRSIETYCTCSTFFFLISQKKKKKKNLHVQHAFCRIVMVTGCPVVADF